MTVLAIESQVFYDAATALHNAGAELFAEVDGKWGALGDCAHMAGTYAEATKWAESYDRHAADAVQTVTNAAMALDNYAAALRTMGYNHAQAEYNATMGEDKGAPPVAPPAPAPAVYTCRIPLPSAGGPQNGLIDGGLKLVEKIGIIVPNGDTAKLAAVGGVWSALAGAAAVAQLPAALDKVIASFDDIHSPEVEIIASDLRTLRSAAADLGGAFAGLAAGCTAHKTGLDELRAKISQQLHDLVKELEKLIAETIAIQIATAWITMGLSAAAATAVAVAKAAEWAAPIRAVIEGWKTERKIEQGITLEQDLVAQSKKLDEISKIGQDIKEPPKMGEAPAVKPASVNLTTKDTDALADYTGPGYKDMNEALRRGTAHQSDAIGFRVDRLNEALGKFPNYEGYVTRRTELPPEVLAKYQKGNRVTEDAFTSSSKHPETAFDGPVEMQIFSKTGKDISAYSQYGRENEVLFRSNTPFDVVDRFPDPVTGRTIIRMIEAS